ncbi:Retrovirus-related Pol polyprotein from transposon TNT 1-94 [Vitis vinifera]|uniref:Retrovirus-related Pol polyprotein from transposon TNT 1-94 n=1 Tax=Vitis vinifera TaxID=29760 RepID=A0A438CLY4_VITVI|nr:Retrovirus-related Pol polyprotein from transposon TNT 1-94 [Vitis vinifera]
MTTKTRNEKIDRYGYVELIHEKSDSLNVFKAFKAKVELQLGKPIKAVKFDRCDIQCQTLLNRMGLQKGGIAHCWIWKKQPSSFSCLGCKAEVRPYNPQSKKLDPKTSVVSLLVIALDQGIPFGEEHVVIPFPTSHVPNVDVPIVQQPATNEGEHGDQVEPDIPVDDIVVDGIPLRRSQSRLFQMIHDLFLGASGSLRPNMILAGQTERYKARLVVKGYSQREGIDFKETFSPVSTKDSFRVIMAIVAHFDLELHQMDVKIAFLNGDLDEDVYMEQPTGFTEVGKEH